MFLNNLSLINFKNYGEINLSFCPHINCFTGKNGSGKTNLLDAIYYLSFCKSFTNSVDSHNIMHNADFFMIQGNYKRDDLDEELYCAMKKKQRKVFKRNKKEYDRLANHVGQYPLVLISFSDSSLILGGSEERRKFTDGVISQYDKEYLSDLIAYNKALQQRNILLKSFVERNNYDSSSLEIWDEQLIRYGERIHKKRKNLFKDFIPILQKKYSFLANEKENVNVEYDSRLNDTSMSRLLSEARQKDRVVQFTSVGIHKDDLLFTINNQVVKKFGSQGQQKSFIIALKLAQFEFTKQIKGNKPILMFDDIFDKLDEMRVNQLMRLVSGDEYGQVFITDTSNKRLTEIFSNINIQSFLYEIDNGEISELNKISGN